MCREKGYVNEEDEQLPSIKDWKSLTAKFPHRSGVQIKDKFRNMFG